jgi:hypothetical protein
MSEPRYRIIVEGALDCVGENGTGFQLDEQEIYLTSQQLAKSTIVRLDDGGAEIPIPCACLGPNHGEPFCSCVMGLIERGIDRTFTSRLVNDLVAQAERNAILRAKSVVQHLDVLDARTKKPGITPRDAYVAALTALLGGES